MTKSLSSDHFGNFSVYLLLFCALFCLFYFDHFVLRTLKLPNKLLLSSFFQILSDDFTKKQCELFIASLIRMNREWHVSLYYYNLKTSIKSKQTIQTR